MVGGLWEDCGRIAVGLGEDCVMIVGGLLAGLWEECGKVVGGIRKDCVRIVEECARIV